MKITVKAIAGGSSAENNREKYDGIDCQDCFSDYMDSARVTCADVISGGYMSFEWDKEKQELYTITEYNSERAITIQEGEELASYTQGQWSDGIGEGFEQFECNDDGDYLSPWYPGQKAEVYPTLQEIREEKIETVLS